MWTAVSRIAGAAGVVGFATCAFTPFPNVIARAASGPPAELRGGAAEAIVVLGGGLRADGSLTGSSLRRLVHGVLLQRARVAPRLVLLGSREEAELRARLARELGVPTESTVTITEAQTTREEVIRVRQVMPPGRRTIVLVTDSQHMLRAWRLFEKLDFAVQPAPADDVSNPAILPEDRLRLARRVIEEIAARTYYRLAGYLS